jgi:hypothetical protein
MEFLVAVAPRYRGHRNARSGHFKKRSNSALGVLADLTLAEGLSRLEPPHTEGEKEKRTGVAERTAFLIFSAALQAGHGLP